MKKKMGYTKLFFIALIPCMLFCSCGKENQDELQAAVTVSDYTKLAYDTEEAKVGDITPVLTMKLTSDAFEKVNYYPFKDGLQVKNVNVARGDTVSKGDVLVTFQSDEINEKLQSYKTRLEEDNLLLTHYNNLANIDTGVDYQPQITEVQEDIQVCTLYINELEATIDSYCIRAEGNGVVTMVSDMLSYGEVDASDNIMTVTYGTGNYVAEVSAEDAELFHIGDIFEASYGAAFYDMVLTDIQDEEGIIKLVFNLAGDESRLLEYSTLNMKLEKSTLESVLYVPSSAVFSVSGEDYVYILDDDGFKHGTKIETVCVVDDCAVVSDGISEGDKVVIAK